MSDGLKELRWLRGLVAERDGHGGDIPVWLALEWIDDAIKRGAAEPKARQQVIETASIPSPSALCPLLGCKVRGSHFHDVVEKWATDSKREWPAENRDGE